MAEGTIEIIPEKDSYQPGDTARIFTALAHSDISVLVTNYNNNIVSYWVEKITGNSAYIYIPVTDISSPNFYFSVSYIKNGHYYSNSRSIAVIPESKFLTVELSSDKTIYKPREEGIINISVRDGLGNPVKNSEVTVGMIDESIYAIRPENTRDIRSAFYSPSPDNSSVTFNHNDLFRYNIGSSYLNLFEMYDYKTAAGLCSVTGKLFNERGNELQDLSVIINNMYLAGVSKSDGTFSFIIPEDSYTLTLMRGNYLIPDELNVRFTQDTSNFLQIKSSLTGMIFATLNDHFVTTEPTLTGKGKIYGTVKDDKGNILFGARIEILGTKIRTGTDENGMFEISKLPDGVYSLKCSYIGNESVIIHDIKINNGNFEKIDFKLSEGGLVMDTVLLLSKRKTLDGTSGKIITSEFIENTGIRSIENIIGKQVGIVQDEEGNIINIRGGRTGQVQIVVDGVITNNPLEEPQHYVEAIARTDFKDAIIWLPAVYTDENGNAQIKVKFPDNLTTWRVTARAITKNTDVGQNTYSVIERKDLIIRVEVPRFFQQNDEVTVSTIIHNYLDEDKKTKVTLRLDNLILAGASPYEQEILLSKNEERRIDWKIRVLNPVGIGNVYASALTNQESDAMEHFIPIQPFGLKVNKYNAYNFSKISGTTNKTFEIPEHTDVRSSNLKLGISPSLASSLLGSLEYLIGYPYGCIEQTMSRFTPTVIAANTLKDMNAPEDQYFSMQIPKMVKSGFQKIFSMQKNDGGWGWWTNDGSDPYMSAYVLYSLQLAKENGYDPKSYKINDASYKNAVNFVKKSLSDKKLDLSTRAFITFVLASSGDTSLSAAAESQFIKFEKKETSSLIKAWLSIAAGKLGKVNTQRKYIADVMREVSFTDEEGAYWGGKIKRYKWQDDYIITTSMVIKALLADPVSSAENKDIVEKAVNWLLAQKRGNAWGNTLQNAFIVYSLSDYIKKYNELEPDYTIKIYVNSKLAAEKRITKEDIFKKEDRFIVTGDMLRAGANQITIEKSGAGKTYLTTALTYYESDTKKSISETENGFDVERTYYKLKKVYDKKKGIYTYKKQAFTGIIKSGEELLIKVKVYPNGNTGNYFMLEDPIPAGCEYIKEDWAYAIEGENSYNGKSTNSWNWWFANKEIRDNRIIFFASSLGSGEREFTYLLRAQIPGTYNIMPTRGMLMYYPEVNGSSNNLMLRIED